MLTILAQAADNNTKFLLPKLFDRLDTLAHPDKLVPMLEQMGWVVASIFVAVGLVCLLQGYKMYKGVVLIAAAGLGVIIGYRLGQTMEAEIIVAGCLGVLLAVVAWPFMKYAVAICGGLAGAFLGANAWSAMADHFNKNVGGWSLPPDAYWAGALAGLILFGLLSFILFEVSVVLFTSISGSVLAVLGIIALLLQVPGWRETISDAVAANPLIIPVIVAVPAIVGLVWQSHGGGLKPSKKSAPAKA